MAVGEDVFTLIKILIPHCENTPLQVKTLLK